MRQSATWPRDMPAVSDQRKAGIRRDLNDLVRDREGRLDPVKIGTLVGQGLAVKLILEHGAAIIGNWDSLTVLFLVLTAPEMFKKLVNMKYGVPTNGSTSTTTSTTDSTTQTTKVEKTPAGGTMKMTPP